MSTKIEQGDSHDSAEVHTVETPIGRLNVRAFGDDEHHYVDCELDVPGAELATVGVTLPQSTPSATFYQGRLPLKTEGVLEEALAIIEYACDAVGEEELRRSPVTVRIGESDIPLGSLRQAIHNVLNNTPGKTESDDDEIQWARCIPA